MTPLKRCDHLPPHDTAERQRPHVPPLSCQLPRTTWEPSLDKARMLRKANLSAWAPGELQEAFGR